jgi:hypothetical protein
VFTKPNITKTEIELINCLIYEHPTWGRTKLSIELCRRWNWCGHDGKPKDISCRDMLRSLDAKGTIKLPPLQSHSRKPGSRDRFQGMLHNTTEIFSDIKTCLPVHIIVVKERTFEGQEFKSLIYQYHYLGFDMTVGENLKYMVYSKKGQLLACLLFGSSAFSCAPRDNFIGWDAKSRKSNLIYTTNNTRFLILPWVRVEHLASHVLGLICKRIASDWKSKYGHPLYLLETFVQKDRFKGTCYKAANWICVGETTGRSRNDRYGTLQVPIKDIYLYPLSKNFKEVLQDASQP